MKVIKYIKLISLALVLFTATNILAQHHGPGKRGGFDLEALKAAVNLTETQETEIKAIREKYRNEMKTLRETEMDDRTEKRTAMQELMKAQREAIQNVLTEEQKATLKAKKEAQQAERKQHWEQKKAMLKEMKAYHEQNVKPVMLTQRAKLETKISVEDKATIAQLRTEVEKHKKEMQAKKMDGFMKGRKGVEGRHRGHGKEMGERQRPAHFETIKGLVEKYGEDIDALFAEVEPQAAEWKEATKAIKEKYAIEKPNRPEGAEKRGERFKGKRGHGKKHAGAHMHKMKKGAFLLLDPASTDASIPELEAPGALTEVSVFPNPATTVNTVKYTVKEAGQVRIELHSEDGNTIKVVVDGYMAAGDYTEQVDLSNLIDGAYYYTIIDQQGISTKTVVVAKQ